MHNADEVVMGGTQYSDKLIDSMTGDASTFKAGLALRRNSSNGPTHDHTAGRLVGVSLGKDQTDADKIAFAARGDDVPLVLADKGVAASIKKGDITFTAKLKGTAGNAIAIVALDDLEDGTATVEIVDDVITIHLESTVTLAEDIKTAIDESEEVSALITATIDSGDEDEAQASFVEDLLEGGIESYGYAVKGAPVYIETGTGKATSVTTYATGATFSSGAKTGKYPDGTTEVVALIDMTGAL